ncbi:F22G5.4 [Arabidopsis thaliana]|uniref:F22G5.4 n=1 Tax=Arabidopsis thaliana TaxID=3702 RepID=Q9LNY1_ARATH|nr:F22G5.4 [Arabidopsis thaliana]
MLYFMKRNLSTKQNEGYLDPIFDPSEGPQRDKGPMSTQKHVRHVVSRRYKAALGARLNQPTNVRD